MYTNLAILMCFIVICSVKAQPPPLPPQEKARPTFPRIIDPPISPDRTRPSSPCPVQACTLEFIPDECREIPKFTQNGVLCHGCPRWIPGCQPGGNSARLQQDIIPRISCPLLACDTHVPAECRIIEEYFYRGNTCQKCPIWREGCREEERINAKSDPFSNSPSLLIPPCPIFRCTDNNIPLECIINQPYKYRGLTCYKCPLRSPNCSSNLQNTNQPTVNQPEVSCPVMECKTSQGFPNNCYQQEFYNYRGKLCEGCPSLTPECQLIVPPQPMVAVVPDSLPTPEQSCPLVQCEFVYIPDECREISTYVDSKGKICQGCPKHRDGCVPSMAGKGPLTSDTGFPQVPNIPQIPAGPQAPVINTEVHCPVKACSVINIPTQCKEDVTYLYQGKTCYDCPKWKEGCTSGGGQFTGGKAINPEPSCPLFGCPLMYIPPECMEERTFQYQGKTCNMCPQWREGCVPLPPPKPNLISPTMSPNANNIPVVPEQSCPVMACTRILIPPECSVEQPYDYNGKTCFKCPIWREGCHGMNDKAPTTPLPPTETTPKSLTNGIDALNFLNNQKAPSISDLKETIPLSNILKTVHAASCPPLRCSTMIIPLQCKEESTYMFQGRICKSCPRWRLGCDPMTGEAMSSNPNGILAFTLFNQLMHQ